MKKIGDIYYFLPSSLSALKFDWKQFLCDGNYPGFQIFLQNLDKNKFPKTLVFTAELHCASDDGVSLVQAMQKAEIPVTHVTEQGCFAGFFDFRFNVGKEAADIIIQWLK